jgi:hypothetical protein
MPITRLVLVLASQNFKVAKGADWHTSDHFNCVYCSPNWMTLCAAQPRTGYYILSGLGRI